jgi:hypothetical protein
MAASRVNQKLELMAHHFARRDRSHSGGNDQDQSKKAVSSQRSASKYGGISGSNWLTAER